MKQRKSEDHMTHFTITTIWLTFCSGRKFFTKNYLKLKLNKVFLHNMQISIELPVIILNLKPCVWVSNPSKSSESFQIK